MAAISGIVGWLLAGWFGFVLAIGFAIFLCLFAGRLSPLVVLRMYRAREITAQNAPDLTRIFQELCRRAELDSAPRLFYIPSRMMNAFAMGSDDNACVAVTDGILRLLRPREMAGVLAHEISHVRHRDIRVLSIADVFTRITSFVSRLGLFVFLGAMGWYLLTDQPTWWLIKGPVLLCAPLFSSLLQLALSRSREFNADMGAVELTGDPDGLISALTKIHRSLSKSHRISYPGRIDPAFLRTHPPLEQRVAELRDVAPRQQPIESAPAAEPDPIQVIKSRQIAPAIVAPVRRRVRWHPSNGLWH